MPRQLALLLCSLFVLYLLRYDRRQPNRSSWTLWMPTLWMLCIASRSIDTWLQVTGGDRMSGGVLDPIFQGTLLCAGWIILLKRQLNWSEVIKDNAWLIVLIGYMLISVLWSDIPARSFRSWIKEIVAVIVALIVVTEPVPQEAIKSLMRRIVYVLIPFSILLVKYYPDRGVVFSRYTGEVQWTGVTLQKNALGQLCLTAVFFLAWVLTRRWQGRDKSVAKYQTAAEVLLLIMALWLLKGPSMWAASATAMVALSFGLATFVALLWMKKHGIQLGMTWILITACIIGVGFMTPLVGGSNLAGFTSALGRDSTLTGRTEIWASIVPDFMRRPILGYGFAGFWTLARMNRYQIGAAHNGYLEVCLQIGAVGLLLTSAFLLSCVRKACRTLENDFDWGCFNLCFLLMIAVNSIADSSIDSFERQIMAIILFLAVSVSTTPKRRFTYENSDIAETNSLVSRDRFS